MFSCHYSITGRILEVTDIAIIYRYIIYSKIYNIYIYINTTDKDEGHLKKYFREMGVKLKGAQINIPVAAMSYQVDPCRSSPSLHSWRNQSGTGGSRWGRLWSSGSTAAIALPSAAPSAILFPPHTACYCPVSAGDKNTHRKQLLMRTSSWLFSQALFQRNCQTRGSQSGGRAIWGGRSATVAGTRMELMNKT